MPRKPREPREPKTDRSSKSHRLPEQKYKDKLLITKLSLQGWSGREMENHSDLSHITYKTINADLKEIELEWQEETKKEIAEYKAKQIKRIEKVIRELFDAWDGSRFTLDFSTKDLPKDLKKTIEGLQEALYKIGNHNYMKQINEAIKELDKILGVHATVKLEDNGKKEVIISFQES